MKQRHFPSLVALFIILTIFPAHSASAADNPPASRLFSESAFITGMGTGNVPEGHYQPVLLIWHLGMDLNKYCPILKDHAGKLSFIIEPQFNPVFDPETDFEAGVGIGLQYRYPLTKKLSAYVLGVTGPHYISAAIQDQANGFIFSSAAGVGVYFFLTEDSALNVGYRFRHLSNAGIEHPNGGIDTHFAVIGYSLFF
ncbi:MAG: acyloxyacyl hydrolase [Deltaproteobacteria bacterium]|nr:acyloxyacyl hydrolase [Deltaproteobacteria bacterium]